jgi:GNAT superfamily N-acetyltransferase
MATTYKPLSASDIDLVIAMMQEFYAIDGDLFDAHLARQLFSEFLKDDNLGKAWLIITDGDVVGYVILTFSYTFIYGGKMAFVDELYLSDRARGKGVGKATIAFVKAEAEILGVKILYLEVEHHNTIAQKLYLSAGFEVHKRKFMQYKIN